MHTHTSAEVIRLPSAQPEPTRKRKGRKSLAERLSEKIDRSAGLFGCWPFTGTTKKDTGRGLLRALNPRTGKTYAREAYVVAWELHHGRQVAEGKLICHTCNNPLCCNPYHLREDTQTGNMADAKRAGKLTGRKLDGEKAREIVELAENGMTVPDLAKRYGCGREAIRNVLRGQTYSWATGIKRGQRVRVGKPKLTVIIGGKVLQEARAVA